MLVLAPAPGHTQWVDYPAKGIPRLKDGKPNLFAPAPKAVGGKPDLSGTWWVPHHGVEGLDDQPPKYLVNLAADLKPEEVQMLPWADALLKQRSAGLGKDFPLSSCLPLPVPSIYTEPLPFKILQTPGLIAILHEHQGRYRQIFMDGRSLPSDPSPSLARKLRWQVGRRDTGGGNGRLQRQELTRRLGSPAHRSAARHRTVPASGFRAHRASRYYQRSQSIYTALDRHDSHRTAS